MKKLIFVLLSVTVLGVGCWLFLAGRNRPAIRAPVTLPDGTSVRILAVTYGTNHVMGTRLARFISHLPAALQDHLPEIFGASAVPAQKITTPTPELIVWLDHQTNRAGVTPPTGAYFAALLGDGSNFISGADMNINSYLPFAMVEPLQFGVFPRRDRVVTLNIFFHDSSGGVRLCSSLNFSNPAFRPYPQWQAEPLPAVKRAGDLEVTLRKVETGHGNSSTVRARSDGSTVIEYDTNRADGRNATVVELKLRPLVNTNEVWQAVGADVSDATGNSTHNSGMSWNGNGPSFMFTPSLWPGEAAWKLKLELKRTEGFRPEEIFIFKNVPLGQLNRTNVVAWTTNIAGIKLTLQSIYRRAPLTNSSWSSSQMSNIHFTLSSLAPGTQLDLVRMVCDTGKTNNSESWSSSDKERSYDFRDIPLAAQTADFTFALQQSRTAEFTVKPELPKLTEEGI